MKSWIVVVLLAAVLTNPALAQQAPGLPEDSPLTEASVPLTYVGGSGRVSIGIDQDGNNQGDAMRVFAADDGESAVVAQLWWQNGGAGGLQLDYNWLWGALTAAQLREQPQKAVVAKLSFAMDQNASGDRKATISFGVERNDYFLSSYLSTAASGGRHSGSLVDEQLNTLTGTDGIGTFTQLQTVQQITPIETQPYGVGTGLRFGRFFDALAMRATAGLDYEDGAQGAHETRMSLSLDKYLGRRGWSVAGQAEHSQRSDAFGQSNSEDRVSVMLRYEFGGQGAFVPSDQVVGPAAVSRALRSPISGHPRTVNVYRSRQGAPTTITTVGTRQYVDRTPIVVADSIVVAANSSGSLIDVLANDSDPDGQPLQLNSVSTPAHGSAQIVGSMVMYMPAAGFVGADSFNYTVSDPSGLSASGSVSVTVQPSVNNSPPDAKDDSASTNANTPISIAVLANDTDPDGDALTITAVTTPTSGGTTQITADGQISYTPPLAFSGTVVFDYTISDGHGGSDSARVTVSVSAINRSPIAQADNATTTPGASVTIDVLANDSDPDGDPLDVVSVSQPGAGTAVLDANNTITYTPNLSASGSDAFSYTISDGRGGSASAQVIITIAAPINNPPIALADNASTPFGTPVTVNVLANDSDPDGDPLDVVSVTTPGSGTAVINANNTITYTPNVSATSTDTFTYTISDGRGGSASAQVTITIAAPINNPPFAVADNATTNFGAPVTINVLANDSDPDGDPLTVISVTAPSSGNVVVNTNNSITYTPTTTFAITVTFTYTISDGRGGSASAQVAVVIGTPINNPPIAVADNATTTAGGTVIINVLANDSDPDGDPLGVVSVTQPPFGSATITADNRISYSNIQNFGTDTFTYTISDGRGGSASATVTVTIL